MNKSHTDIPLSLFVIACFSVFLVRNLVVPYMDNRQDLEASAKRALFEYCVTAPNQVGYGTQYQTRDIMQCYDERGVAGISYGLPLHVSKTPNAQ